MCRYTYRSINSQTILTIHPFTILHDFSNDVSQYFEDHPLNSLCWTPSIKIYIYTHKTSVYLQRHTKSPSNQRNSVSKKCMELCESTNCIECSGKVSGKVHFLYTISFNSQLRKKTPEIIVCCKQNLHKRLRSTHLSIGNSLKIYILLNSVLIIQINTLVWHRQVSSRNKPLERLNNGKKNVDKYSLKTMKISPCHESCQNKIKPTSYVWFFLP